MPYKEPISALLPHNTDSWPTGYHSIAEYMKPIELPSPGYQFNDRISISVRAGATGVIGEPCDDPEPELLELLLIGLTELGKKGFVGSGNVTERDESIRVTVAIGGRSDESACVHNRPT